MSKKLYKIGEAAGALDLKTSVLRFWEGEFPQLQPVRTPKGQRMYREQDMELLRQIRSLVHEQGMTLDGAKRVLAGELAAPDLGEKGERGGKEIPSLRQKRDDLSDYLVEYLTPPEQAPWPKPLSLLNTNLKTEIARDDGLLRSAVQELRDLRELLLTATPEKFSKAEDTKR